MRISEILAFYGPNIWSRNPALEVRLAAEGEAFDAAFSLSNCCDRLYVWYNAAPTQQGDCQHR